MRATPIITSARSANMQNMSRATSFLHHFVFNMSMIMLEHYIRLYFLQLIASISITTYKLWLNKLFKIIGILLIYYSY